jgi:hypothetical protein
MSKIYFYNQTKYPKIYSATYWGHFKGELELITAQHRNEFIDKYNIAKVKWLKNKKIEIYLTQLICNDRTDHLESYITTNNEIIWIQSVDDACENIHKRWLKIDKLYSLGNTTYMYKFTKGEILNEIRIKKRAR